MCKISPRGPWVIFGKSPFIIVSMYIELRLQFDAPEGQLRFKGGSCLLGTRRVRTHLELHRPLGNEDQGANFQLLQMTNLQLILDEPPQALYKAWTKSCLEYYKRVEPTAAPRDVAMSPMPFAQCC